MVSDEELLNPETAERVMYLALEHYIKHYNVVMMKLGHARTATQQGMEENLCAAEQESMRDYDQMWTQIINMFRNAGVGEEDLRRVETVLARIPALIKRYYDLRVEQDETLQQLIAELGAEQYRMALALTRKVQARKDMFSGLDPKEFDPEESTQAFIIPTSRMRENLH